MKKLCLGLTCCAALATASAQSVTVGDGGDYPNLTEALAATSADTAQPDVITFISEGPFVEPARIIINQDYAQDDDEGFTPTPLTIQAAPGIRPRVAINVPADTASSIYLRKIGQVTIKDLIVMPGTNGTPSTHGINIDDHGGYGTDVTLENLLITSNDGNNQPVASLDGRRPPVYDENTVSFLQDGINAPSMDMNQVQKIRISDTVISCIPGRVDRASTGIRGFCDGAPGSEWIVGPGITISYLNTNGTPPVNFETAAHAALQPGDNRNMPMQILGTEEKPILVFNNNLNGIGVTRGPITANDGIGTVQWAIFANNTGRSYTSLNVGSAPANFQNVTFVNNGGLFQGSLEADENVLTFSNVIMAGNGDDEDTSNATHLIYGPDAGFGSTFTMNDSAIVGAGPYQVNTTSYGPDAINADGNWAVSVNNIMRQDPGFISLDPQHGGFGAIANQAYATAGPNGEPLVGGGRLATSSVRDWQLF